MNEQRCGLPQAGQAAQAAQTGVTVHVGQATLVTAAGHRSVLFSPAVTRALLVSCAYGFALATYNLLPKFMVTQLAAGPAEIGIVTSAFGIATVAAVPLVGRWIDRVERRYMICGGSIVMALSSFAFVWIDEYGLELVALKAAQGASFAAVLTAIGALTADLAPPRRLSEALGLVGGSMLAMNAIAPVIVEPLAAGYGWGPVFILAAAFAGLAAALSLSVSDPSASARAANDRVGLLAMLGAARMRHYALITASLGAAFGVMFTFQQPFAMELGRTDISGFFVAYSTVAIAVRLSVGRLTDRLGRFRVSVFSLNLYTVVVLSTAGLRPEMLEIVGAALGLAHGLFFPAFNAIAIAHAGADRKGRVMAIFTGSFYGGLGLGVVVLGALAEVAGYPAVFVATGLIILASGTLLVFSPEFRGHTLDFGAGETAVKQQTQSDAPQGKPDARAVG